MKRIHMHTLRGKELPKKDTISMNCGIKLNRNSFKGMGVRPAGIGCLECRMVTEKQSPKPNKIAFFEG